MTVVAVTGADGVGKSTVIARVAARLAAAGARRVVAASIWDALEHQRTRTILAPRARENVETYLMPLRPTSRALLEYHCLYEALELAEGRGAELCIADGYWYKYCAAGAVRGGDLAELVHLAAIFPQPRQVFYLRLDPALAARRKARVSPSETGGAAGDARNAFVAFQRRLDAVLRRLALERGAVEIDAQQPVETVAHRIVAAIASRAFIRPVTARE